jgi:hypothetical protein
MLLEIEQAILDKLKAALSTRVRLKAFPDNPNEVGNPAPKGQVLVAYKRSSFKQLTDQPPMVEMMMEFEISLQLQNLRTHTGIYEILDITRRSLFGFRPHPEANRGLFPTNEGFQGLEEGIWYYTQSYNMPIRIVAEEDVNFDIDPDHNWEMLEIRFGIYRSKVGSLPNDFEQSVLDRQFAVEAD